MYDIIIKGGKIIDGSGGEPYFADIAIKDGKISKISENIDGGDTVINAEGLVVTPGFIDSHSHADNAVFTYPDMKEKVEQGITTAIAGQCGSSPAPLPTYYDKNNDKMLGNLGKEYDILKTMGSFIEYSSKVPQGCNIAHFVGHGELRKAVMGYDDNREPTKEELEKMKELLRDAMNTGAFGMSLGLYYSPGCYAKTEEVNELAKVLKETNGLISAHIRNEGKDVIEATEEFINIIKAAGIRGVHSHIKAFISDKNIKVKTLFEMIDKANAEGADIYCDVYPYVASHTSLGATFVPAELRANGKMVENLKDPEKREIAKKFIIDTYGKNNDLSWTLVVSAKNRPDAIGKRINQIAKDRGCDVYDAVFDIIVDCNGIARACYFRMNEADVETAIKYPKAMICTDSSVSKGATTYHPRLRASFPRAIGRYARDKQLVPMPEMIRRVTSLPAYVYGLTGKGLLKEGYDADICVFSEEKFIDRAEYTDCTRGCEGLNYVLVSGQIVAENAIHNGKLCGKILRKNG
ncbi:MAG: D-aminoacylase [Ruminococcaceae bacterium]|nr:D-aminoacylase [Oscillospiraceae bacterium]